MEATPTGAGQSAVMMNPNLDQQQQQQNLQQNFQRIMEAYLSLNPTESFRAREYLRKHPNYVPRLVDMLHMANKVNEAQHLKNEFQQVMFSNNAGSQMGPQPIPGSTTTMLNRQGSAGVMPQSSFPSTLYGTMAGPHRTPSPSPMYNHPMQTQGGAAANIQYQNHRMMQQQQQTHRMMQQQQQYYNSQTPGQYGTMHPGMMPPQHMSGPPNMIPPPQYPIRRPAYPQTMMNHPAAPMPPRMGPMGGGYGPNQLH